MNVKSGWGRDPPFLIRERWSQVADFPIRYIFVIHLVSSSLRYLRKHSEKCEVKEMSKLLELNKKSKKKKKNEKMKKA